MFENIPSGTKVNGVTVIHYNPTPLERLENIGRAIKCREVLEKQQHKKLTYVQELESRKRIEEIINKMQQEFGNNLSINKNGNTN